MRLIALIVLVACSPEGQPTPVAGLNISECPAQGDTDQVADELLLVGRQGEIVVAHRAFRANCCHDLEVRARILDDGATISVTYDDKSKEPCDCECRVDLGYTLSELPDGPWLVSVPGQQAQAIVD